MPYLGRVVFGGITPSGNPFGAYAISGRKPGSKKRRFELFEGEGRINVGPIGEPTPEQQRQADLIFYNCMRTRDDFLFVTNGAQTDVRSANGAPRLSFYHDLHEIDDCKGAYNILASWSYEPDGPIFTPRIAMVVGGNGRAMAGIMARQGDDVVRCAGETRLVTLGPGKLAHGQATYKGLDDEARPWRVDDIWNRSDCLVRERLVGETPDELARSLYSFMDKKFVAATAAAVWDGHRWQMAVKNRFNSEEDFAAYLESTKK